MALAAPQEGRWKHMGLLAPDWELAYHHFCLILLATLEARERGIPSTISVGELQVAGEVMVVLSCYWGEGSMMDWIVPVTEMLVSRIEE